MTDNAFTRLAHTGDLADLVDLAVRSFRDAFGGDNDKRDLEDYLSSSMSIGKLEEEIRDANSIFIVACSDHTDNLIGYAKLRNRSCHASVVGEAAIEIERIYADSSMIGKGIGAALMTECLMRARSSGCDAIWLGVWEKNQRAIHFYERWGFSIVGERGFKLGSDMQNDLIMSKRLSREDG